jgi:nitrile hydratase beta subunit
MNGPHDLGGAQGFGPLPLEADEPTFHADWERRALAVTLAMGATGQWNIDMSRSRRESLPPAQYLSSTYYEIWFEALVRLLQERGLIDASERAAIDRGVSPTGATAGPGTDAGAALRVLRADRVAAVLAAGSPTERAGPAPAFAVGARVRARLMNPAGHTRTPRYIRGRPGIVIASHGPHVFADRHATGDEAPQPLYTVRFAAADLWGADTTADAICVDCWEAYLEPATQ